ncbi:MAG TPA: DUF3306 domain-containing protein [Burkholderiaceae bacterium]|nr:DUF3306 domain-containing protein [Burkholderiaceae bacterium]
MAESRDPDDGGFLARWSRRKARAEQGAPVPAEAPPPALPARAEPVEAPAGTATVSAPAEQAPPLTLDDVAALTKDSDFSRFVARDTDPAVKNAAMKRLFASDPHFNQMDGLDVYIDDYNKFEPIPRTLLRQLANARVLGLLDDELEEQPKPDNPPPDENADLQLQPDDAAGQPGAESGVADGGDRPAAPAPDAVPPRSA